MLGRVLVALAVSAAAPGAALAGDEPDLLPELRQEPYSGQVAPVYVDAFEEPGRVLYRFDAILRNQGGTLDLYGNESQAIQAIWEGGHPSEPPDPSRPPTSADATPIDVGARGARFEYVFEKTHDHWHFFTAARYELELPDGSRRVSDKVGFCLFDGFGGAPGGSVHFKPWYTGSGTQTWCGFDHPGGDFVRMGLSPGAADRYASQREFQWIDIAGLRAGTYTLRATANPDGSIVESDEPNNVLRERRTIPGVLTKASEPLSVVDSRGLTPIELEGEVVAAQIPARRSVGCEPTAASDDCYVWAAATGPLAFRIVRPPRHGRAAITAQDGLRATAIYTPADGYRGPDSFEYTATDARGLESPPGLVELEGSPAPDGTQAAAPAGTQREGSRPAARRLLAGLAVRRRGPRWYTVVRLTGRATLRGRLERRGSPYRLVRPIRRRLARGRRLIALGDLRPGRYRLRLRFTAPDGRRSTGMRRFRVPG